MTFYLKHKDPLERARRVIAKKGSKPINKLFTGTVRVPIPKAIEHQVRLRDLNQCQVCGSKRWIDLHHKKPVSEGGTNLAENLTTLCRAHHRLLHADQ